MTPSVSSDNATAVLRTQDVMQCLDEHGLQAIFELPHVSSCLLILDTGADASLKKKDIGPFSDKKIGRTIHAIRYAPIPVAGILVSPAGDVCMGLFFACHFRFAVSSICLGFTSRQSLFFQMMGQEIQQDRSLPNALAQGATMPANDALRQGLIQGVAAAAAIENHALEYVQGIVSGKRKKVITSVMTAVHASRTLDIDEALAVETRLFCDLAKAKNHE